MNAPTEADAGVVSTSRNVARTRKDAHRPSAINPADYQFVALEYVKIEDIGDCFLIEEQRAIFQAHRERTGGTYSGHEHGGNCGVCGSVNAIYTALFYHAPTNSYIRTGMDCAEILDASVDGERFRRGIGDARTAQAGKRKAQATLADAGIAQAWEISQATGERTRDEATVADIVARLVKYGAISPAQMNFLRTLVDRIARRPEIEAARKVEHDAAAPLPVTDARITIRGRIATIKANDFGAQMLVIHADGWKVWGSLPSGIDKDARDQVIEFSARIKPSEGDPKFGYFSRPTKASIIATGAKTP